MNMKKLTAMLITAAAGISMITGCAENAGTSGKKDSDMYTMHGLTTQEFVTEMGVGINLGNTFESCGAWINSDSVTNFETGWGSPVVTKELIQGYKNEGFGVLRVPVAWSNMMLEDYQIHPDYLARVKEVVEWALEADLAVILNIHWDSGWWENFPTDKENCMDKYTSIWTQLCEAFGEYGDRLMFESLNEEAGWSSIWDRYTGTEEQKAESYALVNELNQTFVDLVRSTGGNNTERHLLIAGYITDVSLTCDPLYQMPEDPAGKCAVSVHYYTPATYCILKQDADWGKAKKAWGSPRDYTELETNMDLLYETFVSKGVPVIIGEFSVETANKEADNVKTFLTAVSSEARERDMCPVLWDITNVFYDRYTFQMVEEYSDLNELLMAPVEEAAE